MISIVITCDDLAELQKFNEMFRDSSERAELEAMRQTLLAKRLQLQRAINDGQQGEKK